MASKVLRADRRARGLCVQCGEPAEVRGGKPRGACVACSARMAEAHDRWARARAAPAARPLAQSGTAWVQLPVPVLRQLINSSELVEVAPGVRDHARALVLLRRHLVLQLRGPQRLLSAAMLRLVACAEAE